MLCLCGTQDKVRQAELLKRYYKNVTKIGLDNPQHFIAGTGGVPAKIPCERQLVK